MTQFRQVILNFVTNAAEACEDSDGGQIRVSVVALDLGEEFLSRCQSQDVLEPGQYVCLEVSDNGSGMSDSVVGRVFEPFYTTKFTGRGMGLPTVAGIVYSHGGGLHLRSAPGQGTTICAVFPVTDQSAISVDEPKEPGDVTLWQGSGPVLVVDDDANVRLVVEHMLEAMGFAVLTADGGTQAMALFAEHHESIRLVLLDLTMPGMSGEEVLASLHEKRPETPVVLFSGYSEADIFSRAGGNPNVSALHKPFTYQQFEAAVRSSLRA
jgi:CheY-like chemotaxis protein